MTTLVLRNFISSLFPEDTIINGASSGSKSISVFPGPESRSGATPFVGGAECNDFKKMPANIIVKWNDDTNASFLKAKEIYDVLVGRENFSFDGVEIALFTLLDDSPIWLGRDENNNVEYSIRVDIYYYVGGKQ